MLTVSKNLNILLNYKKKSFVLSALKDFDLGNLQAT